MVVSLRNSSNKSAYTDNNSKSVEPRIKKASTNTPVSTRKISQTKKLSIRKKQSLQAPDEWVLVGSNQWHRPSIQSLYLHSIALIYPRAFSAHPCPRCVLSLRYYLFQSSISHLWGVPIQFFAETLTGQNVTGTPSLTIFFCWLSFQSIAKYITIIQTIHSDAKKA